MGLIKEFKDFAMRGNVVDMAVGIIIGAAFGKIVSTLVSGVIMPPIGMLIGGTNFTDLFFWLGEGDKPASLALAQESGEPYIAWGALTATIIDFLIVAIAIFILIKVMNTAMDKFRQEEEAKPAAPPEPSAEEKLLAEIRDQMKIMNSK